MKRVEMETARAEESSQTPRPFVIGIEGPTGAGKTTLAEMLRGRLGEKEVCMLDQDSYYADRGDLTLAERNTLNFDEPSAFDHDLLFRQLQQLVDGHTVEKPLYCFDTHTRSGHVNALEPKPIIVLEGLMVLWDERIRSLMGLKVYVDADPDVRFIRRLRRDVLERGRSVDSVTSQYLETVRPMHRLYVEPMKRYADLVVDATESLEQAVEAVSVAIAGRLQIQQGRINIGR